MKKISQFISGNPRYNRFKKPLEAANVCDSARALANGRFTIVSFRTGLLTLSVSSPAEMQNLQSDSEEIISEVNKKLGRKLVEKIRYKIG